MTLAHIEALEERRNIRLRHERFNAALSTSAVYNVNRTEKTKPLTPFDFVPGMEEKHDPERERREAALKSIALVIAHLPADISAEEFEALRKTKVAALNERGLDGEQIFREVLHEDDGVN